jgi:hypothetical protein
VSDYSEEELALLCDRFAESWNRFQTRKQLIAGVAAAMAVVVILLCLWAGCEIQFLGILLSLLAATAYKLIRNLVPGCPACGVEVDEYCGEFCPECGAQAVQPARWWRQAHCRACGISVWCLEKRKHRIRYCGCCGIPLTDDGV